MASNYPANSELPQNGSLVSRWLLDEASGTRADIAGSNTLADGNTVGAGTGYSNGTSGASYDNSADFESGNSEYLSKSSGQASGLGGNQDLTIIGWVNPESQPSNADVQIATTWGDADGNREFFFSYRDTAGSKLLRFFNQNGASAAGVSVSQTLSNATWYQVGVTIDVSAGTADFYVNGTQVGTQQSGLNTTVNEGTSAFQLGALGDTQSQFWDGLMQDFQFYNTTYTAQNFSDNYELYTVAFGAQTQGHSFFM